MQHVQLNSAAEPIPFLMLDSADHLTGKTGLSPTVTICKPGGSFAAPAGGVSERGNGWYELAGHAADRDTLGVLMLHAEASGADPSDAAAQVVAFNPRDADALGMGNLDAAVSSRAEPGDPMDLVDAPNGTARDAIATTVESHLLNEGDGEAVLQAIVDKINAVDPDLSGLTLSAIAQAVRDVDNSAPASGSLGEAARNADAKASSLITAIGNPVADVSTDIAAVKADTAAISSLPTAAAIKAAVWGVLTSTLTVSGTIGKRILDFFGSGNYGAPGGTLSELTAGTPPAEPTRDQALMLLYMDKRSSFASDTERGILNDAEEVICSGGIDRDGGTTTLKKLEAP